APEAAFSVFEALRPETGESLDRLAFATYSLDLVAVMGLILSLAGAGEGDDAAGPLRLLDALETLRPKIDIIHQKDRLLAAERHHHILHLLDGNLHPIQPPKGASYHPKMALARYIGQGGKPRWRLWLGSRNLTGGQDREAGLLLCGGLDIARGSSHPDIAAMASELLALLPWLAGHRSELAACRWSLPEGTRLRSLQWRAAGGDRPFRLADDRTTSMIAISPFVDAGGCRQAFGKASSIALLTTRTAASDLGCRAPSVTHIAGAPEHPIAETVLIDDGEERDGPEPLFASGLHAKLFVDDRGRSGRLFIGSANLTRRGLAGPNAELLAELEIPAATVTALRSFVAGHPPAAFAPPDKAELAVRAAERALDEALRHILEAEFTLVAEADTLSLVADRNFDCFLKQHHLTCWLLTCPDDKIAWPAGARSVTIRRTPLPLRLQTLLVGFTAARHAGDCAPRNWAQIVDFPGFDRAARDLAAKADYVRLAGASAWLRGQLEGILPPEGSSWTGLGVETGAAQSWEEPPRPLALEEILAAWARDPDAFEAKVEPIDRLLSALAAQISEEEIASDPDAAADWARIENFWRVLRASIGPRRP
ncbi:MAG TPA: phospholipase D family protein, partial [Sphingopyxis sp.]|nr:phospholipase D family protein [Sphingopyxis sp.]